MTALTEFLFPAPAQRRAGSIIAWWERRRLAYNLMVGGAGLFSVAAVAVVAALPPLSYSWALIPWEPVAIFAALANICYLLGPTVEILVEKLSGGSVLPTGPVLYRMGLTFSVGMALLPTLLIVIGWVYQVVATVF